jgi:hypothetical protein
MGNLKPEMRTDKNGVTSKKWVRDDAALPSGGMAMPAPSVVQDQYVPFATEAEKTAFARLVTGNGFERSPGEKLAQMESVLDAIHPETMRVVMEFGRTEANEQDFNLKFYPHAVIKYWASMFGNRPSKFISNNVHAAMTIVPEDMKRDSGVTYACARVNGVFSEDLPKSRIRDYDDETVQKLSAKFRLIWVLTELIVQEDEDMGGSIPADKAQLHGFITFDGETPILDESLSRVAFEYSDRIHDVVDIVLERRTNDADLISAMLDEMHPALMHGAL